MKRLAIAIVILFAVLLACRAEAGDNPFVQPDELSFNWKHYHPDSRSPLFYADGEQMHDGIVLTMNTDMLLGYLFWDNQVHTDTDYGQFHTVGWHFLFGTRVTSFLTFQYEHHSQHLLDDKLPSQKFPVEDSYGFTLTIYQNRPRGRAILGF